MIIGYRIMLNFTNAPGNSRLNRTEYAMEVLLWLINKNGACGLQLSNENTQKMQRGASLEDYIERIKAILSQIEKVDGLNGIVSEARDGTEFYAPFGKLIF